MDAKERRVVPLVLTKPATEVIFWIFNGDANGPSGVKIANITEARRQDKILVETKKKGLDKDLGTGLACTIEIGYPKDILFLKEKAAKFFQNETGAPSERAVGLVNLLDGIKKAEEDEAEKNALARIEAKERGEEEPPEDNEEEDEEDEKK